MVSVTWNIRYQRSTQPRQSIHQLDVVVCGLAQPTHTYSLSFAMHKLSALIALCLDNTDETVSHRDKCDDSLLETKFMLVSTQNLQCVIRWEKVHVKSGAHVIRHWRRKWVKVHTRLEVILLWRGESLIWCERSGFGMTGFRNKTVFRQRDERKCVPQMYSLVES